MPRETDFSQSINKFEIILNYEQMKQAMVNRQPYQNSLKRKFTLEEQRNQRLSEVRSEMNMQELQDRKCGHGIP